MRMELEILNALGSWDMPSLKILSVEGNPTSLPERLIGRLKEKLDHEPSIRPYHYHDIVIEVDHESLEIICISLSEKEQPCA